MSAENPSAPSGGFRFARATGEMQSTARWLVAGLTGLASFLLAGLTVSDLGQVSGAWLGVGLLGVVLVGAGLAWTIWLSLAVLATPYGTLRDHLARERGGNVPAEILEGLETEDESLFRGLALTHRELAVRLHNARDALWAAERLALPAERREALRTDLERHLGAADRVADYLDYRHTRQSLRSAAPPGPGGRRSSRPRRRDGRQGTGRSDRHRAPHQGGGVLSPWKESRRLAARRSGLVMASPPAADGTPPDCASYRPHRAVQKPTRPCTAPGASSSRRRSPRPDRANRATRHP